MTKTSPNAINTEDIAAWEQPTPSPALLSGWGGATHSRSNVHRPRNSRDVSRLFQRQPHNGIIARGAGRAYGDAALNAGGRVADMNLLRAINRFDTDHGTIQVEAGITIAALLRHTVPAGWALPVVPGTAHVTVGGAIAADVHGKNHPTAGSFASCVRDLTLCTPVGVYLTSRGNDPDLFWATTGGMGLTGIITYATLALEPVETAWYHTRTQRTADLAATLEAVAAAAHGGHVIAWLDPTAGRRNLGRGIISAAHPAPRPAGPHGPVPCYPSTRRGMTMSPRRYRVGLTPVVRVVANTRWHATPATPRTTSRHAEAVLFPLDRFPSWNRLFGARGLIQWQAAIPDGNEDAIARILAAHAAHHATSPLMTLKKLGAATPAPLSFPLPGWTIAIDLAAASEGLPALMDRLDSLTVEAGGRVYLAKDARLRPGNMQAMYPRLGEWLTVRDRVDPDHHLMSDLARRLDLEGAR